MLVKVFFQQVGGYGGLAPDVSLVVGDKEVVREDAPGAALQAFGIKFFAAALNDILGDCLHAQQLVLELRRHFKGLILNAAHEEQADVVHHDLVPLVDEGGNGPADTQGEEQDVGHGRQHGASALFEEAGRHAHSLRLRGQRRRAHISGNA